MKKLMYFALALLFSIGVSAQDDKKMKSNYIKMSDGKIWVSENGQNTQLTSDKTLGNGMVITSTGTVTLKDGTTITLADGDMVDMNGVITRKDARKEKDKMPK